MVCYSADDKWFMQLSVAGIIYRELNKLDLKYPAVDEAQKAALQKAKEELLSDKKKDNGDGDTEEEA